MTARDRVAVCPQRSPDRRLLFGVPPYASFVSVSELPAVHDEGAVVMIDLDLSLQGGGALQRLIGLVRKIRLAHSGVLIGGLISEAQRGAGGADLGLAVAAGLRIWIVGELNESSIRTKASAAGIGQMDLEVWLLASLRPKGLVEFGLVRALSLVLAGESMDAADTEEIRRWVRKLGLPTLRSWKTVGRLVGGAVELQGNPTTAVSTCARSWGFADAPSFSHAFRRVFDTTPTRARELIGWEWLLTRFLARR